MALAMAFCAALAPLLSLYYGARPQDGQAWITMLLAGLTTGMAGWAFWWHGREAERKLGRREAILVVALIWIGAGVFGGLPFVFDARLGPADAFFEAISGFTTTGATIVVDIEATLSRPLLLWRSLIQWLGGMGIVVLFVAVFPNIGVGGKHLFRSEVPGPVADGLRPRIGETSVALWQLYAGFTAVQIVLLWLFGMDLFEAICHAFTTMSTGGFSTRNASIGAFDSVPIELVTTAFMLIAGVNFALYFHALRRRSVRGFLRSTELRAYVVVVAVATVALWLAIWGDPHPDGFVALRKALFMVATTVTSTGYGTDGMMTYPPLGLGLVLLMMFVGGSAGSTAGGIKIARVVLLLKLTWGQMRKSFRPTVVHVVRMSRKPVEPWVLFDVAAFFVVYMLIMGAGTLAVSTLEGVGLPAAFGAMLTSLSNMGPAPFTEFEVDTFAPYSPLAKFWFAFAMILGRLEFFTLLALLLPDFWRR